MTEVFKQKPDISFILPIFHVPEKLLSRAIDSVLKQTNNKCQYAIEVILVFDGEQNEYNDAAQVLKEQHASILRTIRIKHSGVSEARNVGLQCSLGEWVFFLDADDCLADGSLEKLSSAISENNTADLLVCDYLICTRDRRERHWYKQSGRGTKAITQISDTAPNEFIRDTLIPQSGAGFVWGKLFRRTFLVDRGLQFRSNLFMGEDAEYMLRVALAAPFVYYLPEVIYQYYIREGSAVRSKLIKNPDLYTPALHQIRKDLEWAGVYEKYQGAYVSCVAYHLLLVAVNGTFHAGLSTKMPDQIRQFRALANENLYQEAIQKTGYRDFSFARKVGIFCAKHGLYHCLWLIAKVRHQQIKSGSDQSEQDIINADGKQAGKKRVLVFGMTPISGGVERFLNNYDQYVDHSRLQFDYLCNSRDRIAYEKELIERGARTFYITARSENPVQYYKELICFFREHAEDYHAIWVNVCSLANIDYLIFAKRYGIGRRIIHSHNSRNMDSALRGFVHHCNRLFIGKYATDFWACSKEAGNWFYPKKLKGQVRVIKNAFDIHKMRFSPEGRDRIRKLLGIKNEYLVGNIGRLHFQKNQTWTIEVFAELFPKMPDARLVLVGQGEDKEKLQQLVKALQLEDQVYFVGQTADVGDWLSAMDLFLFPSLFEGMPYSLLEAQANGIPILASGSALPEEAKINQNCYRMSLSHSRETWAERIVQMRKKTIRLKPDEVRGNFTGSGFDIRPAAAVLQQEFLK